MKIKLLLTALIFSQFAISQSTRIKDSNSIGWYNYNGTFKLNSKFGVHTEYQWRREEYIKNGQQGLLRLGVNYQLNSKLQLRFGYAWIETYPYGDITLNSFGKDFTEHRLFEMATISDQINRVELSHRFMLEQRWIGRYSNATLSSEDKYLFMNRFRYMFRAQIPLKGKTITSKTPYAAIYDEILIGFGNNVIENIFDQNRLGIILGYKFNSNLKMEAGYLNQMLQLGREVNNQNVLQYNNGFIISTILNF